MIRFDRVRKRFANGQVALDEVSFALDAREMAFLTGHSGAGKTTLLKLIACMERPNQGQVVVDHRNIGKLPNRRIPAHRRQLGLIHQDHKLLSGRSLLENVCLPLVVGGLSRREREKRGRAALDQVGLLARAHHPVLGLSGGEQQRVGIARAIVARPRVLLADEPTGNLDPKLSREIFELFRRLNEQDTAVLIASHDLQLISTMGCRVLVLEHGRLIDDIAPEALRGH